MVVNGPYCLGQTLTMENQTYNFISGVREDTSLHGKQSMKNQWAHLREHAVPQVRSCSKAAGQHREFPKAVFSSSSHYCLPKKLDEWEDFQKMANITASIAKSGLLK